jgi:rRNA small subunit pseudouridine methyltransferase Nep1
VKSYSKKRGKKVSKILLDDNYHHSAIRQRFPHSDEELRRGRPDIVHLNMVYVLDSIANQDGKVRLYIHTRNDVAITVNPAMRVPKSFPRFVGIIEKLLWEGIIKTEEGEVLLECEKGVTLGKLLGTLKADKVVGLSPDGEKGDLSKHIQGDVSVVVGGFSKGDFLSKFEPDLWISVYGKELTSWAVVAEIMKHI